MWTLLLALVVAFLLVQLNDVKRRVDLLEKKQGIQVLSAQKPEVPGIQLSIFDTHTEVFAGIREMMSGVDVNNLTPVEALVILSEIKKKIN